MSLYDYKASLRISLQDYPFYAIIMAAMRGADTLNLSRLQNLFPEVYEELRNRYNAPGGRLTSEDKP